MEGVLDRSEVIKIMDTLLEELAIAIDMTEDFGHSAVIRELKKQYRHYDTLVQSIVLAANHGIDTVSYEMDYDYDKRILIVTDHFLECIELSYDFLGKSREVQMIIALKNELYHYDSLLHKLLLAYDPTKVKYFTI